MRPQNHHTNLSRRASKSEANLPDGETKGRLPPRVSARFVIGVLVNHLERVRYGKLVRGLELESGVPRETGNEDEITEYM
jgi:hypothetical protein